MVMDLLFDSGLVLAPYRYCESSHPSEQSAYGSSQEATPNHTPCNEGNTARRAVGDRAIFDGCGGHQLPSCFQV